MEASIEPNVESHGSPRRTVGFNSLASNHVAHHIRIHQLATECTTLAIQSEEAANTKAKSRDLLSATPAFIRHALRRAEAEVSLMTLPAHRPSTESPEDKARESVMCSDDAIDIVNGWLTVSRCAHGLSATDALLSAIETASSSGLEGRVPVASYIEAIKQLIALGRFKDASRSRLLLPRHTPLQR